MPAMKTYADALKEASHLAAEAATAAANNDFVRAEQLQQQADAAFLSAKRLAKQHVRQISQRALEPSAKQQTVEALTELGVASSPRQIAAYATARRGGSFDVRALASIRRDERRSWNSGSVRDIYVVPSLEGPWLAAGRGRFGLSHWPLWRRIVGPLTPRADHLRACMNLVGQVEQPGIDEETKLRMRHLLAEYARTVSGAFFQPWGSAMDVDTVRVLAAVQEEFALLGHEDEKWRKQEAERALRHLTEEQRVWGGEVPQLVGGTESGNEVA